MLRQNQIGTSAMNSIAAMPSAKRIICGSAQGISDPPATENNCRKPTQATLTSNRVSGQFRYSTLRSPVGTVLTLYSR